MAHAKAILPPIIRRDRLQGALSISRRFAALALVGCLAMRAALAALQFDVFIGYDGATREGSWFPVAIEVFNDGPSFNGVIELSSSQFGGEPDRRIPVELPTNTRKRLVVPMFATSGRTTGNWDARLLDSNRKVRADRLGLQVRSLNWQTVILGAVPGSFAGTPLLPKIKGNQPEMQPAVARFQSEQFPDNPIALEGMDVLYIHSGKAINLPEPQLAALLAWVRGGGHLILGVDQVTDVNSTPWLQQFLPIELNGLKNLPVDIALSSWLKSDVSAEETEEIMSGRAGNRRARSSDPATYYKNNVEVDAGFVGAQMPVAGGKIRDGRVLIGSAQAPLAVQASRGRGKLTVLLFNPEREPFKAWKSRDKFWARMSQIPPQWFDQPESNFNPSWSMDGVFGALIDSRQVKKLPVEWLLLLLLVYLVVIGPFDQWWLKKINRQMLTWITFPCYVVFFSLLIYFIGYKLRAGETEWNEVQIVDVYPHGDQADLRGRSYVSIYSSGNETYPIVGEPTYSSLRPEFVELFGAANHDTKINVEQIGNSFKARVFVPVWTSMLFVNDWFKSADRPLNASVAPKGSEWAVKIENPGDHRLKDLRVVIGGNIYELGALDAGQTLDRTLNPSSGKPLDAFLSMHGGAFQAAVEARRNPLGRSAMPLDDRSRTVTVASFYRLKEEAEAAGRSVIGVPGLDMSNEVRRGDAVILAWDEGNIATKPINQFEPIRKRRDTMLRLVVPVKKS